jgi:hypothetical protein
MICLTVMHLHMIGLKKKQLLITMTMQVLYTVHCFLETGSTVQYIIVYY